MTEEEREMMTTIHLYGLVFSMDDRTKDAALDYIEATFGEERKSTP